MTATEVKHPTISKPLIFINRGLIFCQLFILGGLATLAVSRLRLEEAGLSALKSSDYRMGTRLVDIFVHAEMLALLAAMVILTIYKETKMSAIKTKIFTNFMTLGIIAFLTEILISTLYPI
jgi:hypothetical protein